MRLRLILDATLTHTINPRAEVLTTSSVTNVTAIVWDINPNIPIASPVHLQRLQSLLLLKDTADVAFFLVAWSSSHVWAVASYADPARTAYDLGLREESAMFLTRDPYSALLSIAGAAMLPLHEVFWVPPPTAALRFEPLDANASLQNRTLEVVGRTARRVWKRGGGDAWGMPSVARATFPSATLPVANNSTDTSRAPDASAVPPHTSAMRWSFRVGFDDPKALRVPTDVDWPIMYGDALFARDATKGRGNSLLVAAAANAPRQPSAAGDASEADDTASDSSDKADEEIVEGRDVGLPLPSMLLGFGIRSALDAVVDLLDERHRQPADGASSAVPSAASVPLFEIPPNELAPHSCCLLDTRTGALYVNSGQQQPVQYADVTAYEAQLGMILSFAVDPFDGVLNILQDDRLILVATLPPRMREAMASEQQAAGGSGVALCPLVQLGTLGGLVDIF